MADFTTIDDIIGPDVANCECCHHYPAQTDHQDYRPNSLDNVLRVCWPCRLAGLLGHALPGAGLNLYSRISALVRYQNFTRLEQFRADIIQELSEAGVESGPIMVAWDPAIEEMDQRFQSGRSDD